MYCNRSSKCCDHDSRVGANLILKTHGARKEYLKGQSKRKMYGIATAVKCSQGRKCGAYITVSWQLNDLINTIKCWMDDDA